MRTILWYIKEKLNKAPGFPLLKKRFTSGQYPLWPQTHGWLGMARGVLAAAPGEVTGDWAALALRSRYLLEKEQSLKAIVGGPVCKSEAIQMGRDGGGLAQESWASSELTLYPAVVSHDGGHVNGGESSFNPSHEGLMNGGESSQKPSHGGLMNGGKSSLNPSLPNMQE